MIRVWPTIGVGVGYLLLVGGSAVSADGTALGLLDLLLVAIVFGGWTVAAWRDPRWRPASVLWPALLAVVGVVALTTLLSRNGTLSQSVLAELVILAGLYLLARELLTDDRARALIAGSVTVVAFVVSGLYLGWVLVQWVGWWLLFGAPAVPPLGPGGEGLLFGDPGTVAAVAALGLVTAWAWLGTEGRRARLVLAALGGMTAAVVVASGSVSAWIAAGIALGVVVVAGLGRGPAPGRTAVGRSGRRVRRQIAALVAIVAMLYAVTAGPAIATRFIESGQAAERVTLAIVSGRMLAGAPLTGTGPGTWADQRIGHTVAPETDAYVADPGSGLAKAIVETGIVGVAALAFAVACVLALVRSALADTDPVRRRWGVAALAATAYLVAHQVLGTLAVTAPLALAAIPIAWVDATETRPLIVLPEALEDALASRGLARNLLLGAGLAGLGIAVIASALAQRSAMDMAQARSAVVASDWAGAVGPLVSAATTDPAIPAPLLPLGLAQARAGDVEGALATFVRLSDEEDLPVAWINRAWLEAAAGDGVAARRSLNRGMRLGYQQPQLALAAGLVHEQLGDLADSTRWYVEALVLEPGAAGSGFWQSGDRVARWTLIVSRVLERLDPAGEAELWISTGDLDAADAAIEPMPAGPERTLLELVIAAWGNEPGARDALARQAREHPGDVDVVGWAARVAAHAGDTAAAQRYRDWAAKIAGGAPVRDADVTIELPPISAARKTGLASIPWGEVTYRRATPDAQLPSDMPQLALAP